LNNTSVQALSRRAIDGRLTALLRISFAWA